MTTPFLIDDLSPTRVHGVSTTLREAIATQDAGATSWTVISRQSVTGGVQGSTPAVDRDAAIVIVCNYLAQ